ncbi:MAG: transposase [Bryobacteraceae bacterium]
MLRPAALRFRDENAARRWLEETIWPTGPVCPHCEVRGKIYKLRSKEQTKHKLREGIYKCGECRKMFTVRVGTIFQGSHVPIHKWLLAIELIDSCVGGRISARQIMRTLQLGSYRTAWLMTRRIRAMLMMANRRLEEGLREWFRYDV